MNKLDKITTKYGNIDVRRGVPKGLVYLGDCNLQGLCARLRIAYRPALIGWVCVGLKYRPKLKGVVINASDEAIVRAAMNPVTPFLCECCEKPLTVGDLKEDDGLCAHCAEVEGGPIGGFNESDDYRI